MLVCLGWAFCTLFACPFDTLCSVYALCAFYLQTGQRRERYWCLVQCSVSHAVCSALHWALLIYLVHSVDRHGGGEKRAGRTSVPKATTVLQGQIWCRLSGNHAQLFLRREVPVESTRVS